MTLAIMGTLLMGLVGLIWVMVIDTLGDSHHSHDKQQGSSSPELHDGEDPHERSSRQSKVTA